jgi:hypothetical protein
MADGTCAPVTTATTSQGTYEVSFIAGYTVATFDPECHFLVEEVGPVA